MDSDGGTATGGSDAEVCVLQYVVTAYSCTSTKVVLQYYSTAVCYGQRDAMPKLTA